jgi:hypothetical protein
LALFLLFLMPDLFAACFDFTVLVLEGAMVVGVLAVVGEGKFIVEVGDKMDNFLGCGIAADKAASLTSLPHQAYILSFIQHDNVSTCRPEGPLGGPLSRYK